jgi:hypothetical protein
VGHIGGGDDRGGAAAHLPPPPPLCGTHPAAVHRWRGNFVGEFLLLCVAVAVESWAHCDLVLISNLICTAIRVWSLVVVHALMDYEIQVAL